MKKFIKNIIFIIQIVLFDIIMILVLSLHLISNELITTYSDGTFYFGLTTNLWKSYDIILYLLISCLLTEIVLTLIIFIKRSENNET